MRLLHLPLDLPWALSGDPDQTPGRIGGLFQCSESCTVKAPARLGLGGGGTGGAGSGESSCGLSCAGGRQSGARGLVAGPVVDRAGGDRGRAVDWEGLARPQAVCHSAPSLARAEQAEEGGGRDGRLVSDRRFRESWGEAGKNQVQGGVGAVPRGRATARRGGRSLLHPARTGERPRDQFLPDLEWR